MAEPIISVCFKTFIVPCYISRKIPNIRAFFYARQALLLSSFHGLKNQMENDKTNHPDVLTSEQSAHTEQESTVTEREKELLIRDLAVRGALMEMKAKQSELIETNEQLNNREKQLLLRDLEVRSMLMEVKVAKEELSKKNEHLAGREKELIMRDLEVRTVLMELKVAQEQLVERHSELESMMNIVKEINKANDLHSLLQVMLSQLMLILPTAEKGSFLLYDNQEDNYFFAATYGYDPELIRDTRLSRQDLDVFYLRQEFMVSEGIYVIIFKPEIEEKGHRYFIEKPVSAIALPIKIDSELKGMLFLDNFTSVDAFRTSDVDKISRFREHAISAFTKVALLNELNTKNVILARQTEDLQNALTELQSTQHKLILSEKMAALGQVISNMAHEVNTPIAAINGAGLYILHTLPGVLEKLPHIFKSLNEEQETLFFELINLSLSDGESISTTLERKYRKEIQEDLERLEIYEDAPNIARRLIQCGVVRNAERYVPLIRHPEYNDLLNTASQIGRIKMHVNNIVIAVSKAQRAVVSYKSFTDDHAPVREATINFNESIEQVLSIYRKTNDDKLEIITDFEEFLPSIRCYPEQLTQIWTHLIHNAIHAMGGKGKIEIKTFLKGGKAHAVITDDGPGIPDDIRERIFEPFFTTKNEGEGGGLGLHVTQKFVQNHMGTIDFSSMPGQTSFTVAIPYNRMAVLI